MLYFNIFILFVTLFKVITLKKFFDFFLNKVSLANWSKFDPQVLIKRTFTKFCKVILSLIFHLRILQKFFIFVYIVDECKTQLFKRNTVNLGTFQNFFFKRTKNHNKFFSYLNVVF